MMRFFFLLALVSGMAKTLAEPISPGRIKTLPAAEQPRWMAYLERSRTNAQADASAVQVEVVANAMTNAVRAPNGGNFKLPAQAGDDWYAGKEARKLTDAVLSYQTPTGGWSKHIGYGKGPRPPGMQWTSQNEPGKP